MSLTKNKANFKEIEEKIYRKLCKQGAETLKNILEELDDELMRSRDHSIFRHKGKRKTVIKTIMGEVEYSRIGYERTNEDGTKSFVYLLDEAIGKETTGFVSGLLSERIVEEACCGSYRHAAQSISDMTGQNISHTAAWTVVQQFGKKINEHEQKLSVNAARNKGCGEIEADVLFEEMDGIFLPLQGKSREKYGKMKEMKVAIAYDGAEKRGENRFSLTNKVATASFDTTRDFFARKEGKIADKYCVDEVKTRVLNGDGASWIKRDTSDETVVYQLDPFHRNKAICKYVGNPNFKKEIFRLLYTKQIDLLLDYIDALSNSVGDEKESEDLRILHRYFLANRDGLISWRHRNVNIPSPSEGKEYRNLGAMESNVFTIIGNRMKGGRACWSIEGGNNLARLLTLKHTGKLRKALNKLATWTLPEKYAEEVLVKTSYAKTPKYDGCGYEPARSGVLPATPNYKFLREIGKIKTDFF